MQEISFVKPGNFFLQKFEKCQNVIFGPMLMLRQSCVRASRASPAQKWQGLTVVLSKNFSRATFFCFLGYLVGRYVFELNTHETNLMKKRSVYLYIIYE